MRTRLPILSFDMVTDNSARKGQGTASKDFSQFSLSFQPDHCFGGIKDYLSHV